MIVGSHSLQTLAFKTADLEVQHENLSAYTAAPVHHLTSIAASTMHFLSRSTGQNPPSTDTAPLHPLIYNTDGRDAVLAGLWSELDDYLRKPRAELFKTITQASESGVHVIWCDPLRYWTVRVFSCLSRDSSPAYIGC